MTKITRCAWCTQDPLYQHYHDHEWGKPVYDEHQLFEMLCLEGQQAGLAWITVLKKREAYRQHFFNLAIEDIARITNEELLKKQQDPQLIRHLAKLTSIRDNAQAWLKLKSDVYHISDWLWAFTKHITTQQNKIDAQNIPSYTIQSEQLASALKKRGFKFVGKTTCYAFMQACGMVNDHETRCTFR